MQGKDDCDDIVKSMPQFWEAYELLEQASPCWNSLKKGWFT